MKYTIELTENQATRVNDILLGVSESWGYEKGKLKLEPMKEPDNDYTKGYNTAITDYNMMIEWLHDCTFDFRKWLIDSGFYKGVEVRHDPADILYDLICDHDIREVISEFKKWQKTNDSGKLKQEINRLKSTYTVERIKEVLESED